MSELPFPLSVLPAQPAWQATGRPSPALRWPDADTMFRPAFDVDWTRRLKYLLRLWPTASSRARVLRAVSGDPVATALFQREPRAFYPVMNHLIDRRFDQVRRCDALVASLRTMRRCMGGDERWRELVGTGLELFALPDGHRLLLSTNTVSYHEGLWQLAVVDASGTRIYSLGFGFLDDTRLLVANVQGASACADGLDKIRVLTDAAHGLRPPYLLMEVLRACAQRWGLRSLAGVDPDHHVKGRWNLRASRLRFDYRAFWQEQQGLPGGPDGHWQLPLALPARPLSDVPAKRRAMYRRRHQLLDECRARLDLLFGPVRPGA